MSCALDSSVVLAVMWGEAGAENAADQLRTGVISAVNYSETFGKLIDRGLTREAAETAIDALALRVVSFDEDQALAAGRLRETTRGAGLSLADRACLALAAAEGVPALTADRAWSRVDIGVEIEVIR